MALTRQQKEQRIKTTTEDLSGAVSYVFLSYDAFNVEDVEELRGQMHEQGVSMRVMPKRLLKIVLQNVELDFDPTQVDGQLAVVWGSDAVAPAKVLYEFAKERDNLKLVAGAMDGSPLSAEEVTALAQLPGREELLAKLVGTLAGPISGFQSVLSGVQRNAVYVLTAVKEQKEKEENNSAKEG